MKLVLTRFLVAIAVGVGIVLMVLLTSAGSRSSEFESGFAWLLMANAAVAFVLLVAVVSLLARMIGQVRAKTFGSQTLMRLAGLFSLVAVLPCVLIFAISSHLVSEAFNTGMDSRIESALGSGAELSRQMLSRIETEDALMASNAASQADSIEELLARMKLPAEYAVRIYGADGSFLTGPGDASPLEANRMEVARREGVFTAVTGDPMEDDAQDRADKLSLETVVVWNAAGEPRFVELVHVIPSGIASSINNTVRGLRDYQENVFVRYGMQGIYHWSLILTVVLTALASILAAFLFSSNIVRPLRQLEEGTRQAFGGKLHTIREFSGSDEINTLTRAFNTMIRRINDAYGKLDARRVSLERTNIFLERILGNLSTAVIVLDAERLVRIANEAAIVLLGQSLSRSGVPLEKLNAALARIVIPMLSPGGSVRHEGVPYETIEKGEALSLIIQTTPVPLEDGLGYIVMATDMTQAVAAQRAIAWGEVARRLAHEIKNPLTPIQLAAERIQYKLEGVLDDEHRKLLERHTKTIVEQVGIMNGMVRDFRDYAKLPKPKLLEMQLNEVLEEVRHLYEHDDFAMALELDAGLKPLRADKAQILQVLHNLLSNAREAARPGTVCHVRITTKNMPQGVLLNITDDGTGFPQSIMDKAFEPYVTTKATGTGLGLPMVKKIADEHAAQLTLANDPDTGGGSVTILFTLLAPARANRAKTLEEKSS